MSTKILSKIAIAASLVAIIYAAPTKAQEHAVSTGVIQSEVKGDKKVQTPITAKQHKGAQTASGKDLKKPPVQN